MCRCVDQDQCLASVCLSGNKQNNSKLGLDIRNDMDNGTLINNLNLVYQSCNVNRVEGGPFTQIPQANNL